MNLTDTHAHLYWNSFKEDPPAGRQGFDEMLQRAIDVGVSTIINVGVDLEKSEEALKQVQDLEKDPKWQNMKFFSTIGIHPHEALRYAQGKLSDVDVSIRKDIEHLEQIYHSNISKCIGIGECGLDFLFENNPDWILHSLRHSELDSESQKTEIPERIRDDEELISQIKNLQKKLFQAQIELAKNLHLPLIVHCRDDRSKNPEDSEAWDETIDMTKDHFGIYHCYSGLPSTTNLILNSTNFLISFAANITYPKNDYLRDAAKIIPLNRIVLETDSPFLAPQNKRGQRNEPSNILEVAKPTSEIKKISLEEVARQTTENVAKLLRLG